MDYVVLTAGALLAAVGVLALAARRTAVREDAGPSSGALHDDGPDAAARFDTLLEVIPAGVVIVEPPGRITAINSSAATMFGIAPDRAVGRALIECIRSYEL